MVAVIDAADPLDDAGVLAPVACVFVGLVVVVVVVVIVGGGFG